MTQNQIAYRNLQELRQHNRAMEAETARHNKSTENISSGELAEKSRHNTVSENTQWATLGETAQHNRAQEQVNWYTAQSLAGLQTAQSRLAESNVGVQAQQAINQGIRNSNDYSIQQQQQHIAQQQANLHKEEVELAKQRLQVERDRVALEGLNTVNKAIGAVRTLIPMIGG